MESAMLDAILASGEERSHMLENSIRKRLRYLKYSDGIRDFLKALIDATQKQLALDPRKQGLKTSRNDEKSSAKLSAWKSNVISLLKALVISCYECPRLEVLQELQGQVISETLIPIILSSYEVLLRSRNSSAAGASSSSVAGEQEHLVAEQEEEWKTLGPMAQFSLESLIIITQILSNRLEKKSAEQIANHVLQLLQTMWGSWGAHKLRNDFRHTPTSASPSMEDEEVDELFPGKTEEDASIAKMFEGLYQILRKPPVLLRSIEGAFRLLSTLCDIEQDFLFDDGKRWLQTLELSFGFASSVISKHTVIKTREDLNNFAYISPVDQSSTQVIVESLFLIQSLLKVFLPNVASFYDSTSVSEDQSVDPLHLHYDADGQDKAFKANLDHTIQNLTPSVRKLVIESRNSQNFQFIPDNLSVILRILSIEYPLEIQRSIGALLAKIVGASFLLLDQAQYQQSVDLLINALYQRTVEIKQPEGSPAKLRTLLNRSSYSIMRGWKSVFLFTDPSILRPRALQIYNLLDDLLSAAKGRSVNKLRRKTVTAIPLLFSLVGDQIVTIADSFYERLSRSLADPLGLSSFLVALVTGLPDEEALPPSSSSSSSSPESLSSIAERQEKVETYFPKVLLDLLDALCNEEYSKGVKHHIMQSIVQILNCHNTNLVCRHVLAAQSPIEEETQTGAPHTWLRDICELLISVISTKHFWDASVESFRIFTGLVRVLDEPHFPLIERTCLKFQVLFDGLINDKWPSVSQTTRNNTDDEAESNSENESAESNSVEGVRRVNQMVDEDGEESFEEEVDESMADMEPIIIREMLESVQRLYCHQTFVSHEMRRFEQQEQLKAAGKVASRRSLLFTKKFFYSILNYLEKPIVFDSDEDLKLLSSKVAITLYHQFSRSILSSADDLTSLFHSLQSFTSNLFEHISEFCEDEEKKQFCLHPQCLQMIAEVTQSLQEKKQTASLPEINESLDQLSELFQRQLELSSSDAQPLPQQLEMKSKIDHLISAFGSLRT